MYRQRFGLSSHVFPQDAQGDSYIEVPGYTRLKRRFDMLCREPGLGALEGDAGVGKTAAMRNLCGQLPRPDYQVIYLCDTAVSPLDLYRQLAVELGVTPSHRRAQLWLDIKAAMLHMVDEQGIQPLLVIDEAQLLGDRFLVDLAGFLNVAMDSRNLVALWLVGQPPLLSVLRMKRHAALASRLAARVRLEPLTDRETFMAFLRQGLEAAGAHSNLFADTAAELLFRASRGVPRRAAWLLKETLMAAHDHDKNFVDDAILEAILDEEDL
ncbi:AAA family ATPase [bacterium]|nr:AAA family ATPase [bacterium]